MINDSNISDYLRRFEQGLLTNEELDQFTLFLESISILNVISNQPHNKLSLEFKESLKKAKTCRPTAFNKLEGDDNELLMFASIEGIINEKEMDFLNLKVSTDVQFASTFNYYKLTKLEKEILSFPNKSGLKQKEKQSYPRFMYYAAAAILTGFLLYYNQNDKKLELSSSSELQLAKTKEIQTNRTTLKSNLSNNTPNKVFKKTIYSAASSKVDTTFYIKNESMTIANSIVDSIGLEITQNEKESLVQESQPKVNSFQKEEDHIETLTWKNYMRNKFEELVFGKIGSSYEERLAYISSKFQSRTGIPFQIKLTKKSAEKRKLSKLVFGKFSYERN
jgi:hypothetical protein